MGQATLRADLAAKRGFLWNRYREPDDQEYSAVTRMLSRLGITRQIALIGVLGVLGLIIVGVVFYIGSALQDTAQQQIEAANVRVATLSSINVNLLEARKAEKDFLILLIRGKDEFAQKRSVAANAAAGNAASSDIKKLRDLSSDAGTVATIDKLLPLISNYITQFTAVAQAGGKIGSDENSGLHGSLRKAVHEVEEVLKSSGDVGLDAAMLMMRRHEKDFLARGDAKYLDEMKTAASDFEGRLGKSNLTDEQKSVVKDKLAAYQRDFSAVVAATQEIAGAMAALSKAYTDTEPLLAKLDSRVNDAATASKAEALSIVSRVVQVILGSIVLMAVVVGLLAWFVSRGVARVLVGMSGLMERLAAGDLAIEVSGRERKDEIGKLARSLEVFRENAETARRLEAEQQAETLRKEKRQEAMDALISDFSNTVEEVLRLLAASASEMHATSGSMAATAEETSRQAAAVAAASAEASVNVQTVASAAEQLSSTVSEITRQVTHSATIAGKAVAEVQHTNTTVLSLAEAAQRIGDVVRLIQEIASQTNLLALNATIEAARAGEAGKGFAVVASEVKALATQTSNATEDISGQVASIQDATSQAVSAIENIGRTISEVSEIATAIAGAVEEQGAATQEISRSTVVAANGTELVSSNIAGVNQAAGKTSAAALQVRAVSEQLTQETARLRDTVEGFLENIRAA
jgi:methyl-accepting chemotaxis protein